MRAAWVIHSHSMSESASPLKTHLGAPWLAPLGRKDRGFVPSSPSLVGIGDAPAKCYVGQVVVLQQEGLPLPEERANDRCVDRPRFGAPSYFRRCDRDDRVQREPLSSMAAIDVPHQPLPRDPARLLSPVTSPKAVAALGGAMEAAAAAPNQPSGGRAIVKVTSVDIMGSGGWAGEEDDDDELDDGSPVKQRKPTEPPADPALEVLKLRQQVGPPALCPARAPRTASRHMSTSFSCRVLAG